MDSSLEIVNPLEIKNWDDLIAELPGSSFFHTRPWVEVLHQTYKYLPFYFISRNKTTLNRVIPFMEINSLITGKRGVSLPFTDTCRLTGITPADEKFLDEVIIFGKSRKWNYIELRDDLAVENKPVPSASFYEHIVSLDKDTERLFKTFRSSTRRNISKAEKVLSVERKNTPEALQAYYRLHCLTRKRQGVPPQSFRFFQNIFKYVISRDKGNIFFAKHAQETIAGMIFFHHKQEVIYKYGASDFKFQSFRPNNLLMWEAIKFYAAKKFQKLTLGRTEFSHEGLRQFKTGFNPDEIVRHYYRLDLRTGDYVQEIVKPENYREKLFKLLPMTGLKFIGRVAYKHMG